MWEPTYDHIQIAFAHAEQCAPEECCAVIANGEYFPIQNRSEDPENYFRLDPEEYLTVARTFPIEAVVHSHPYGHPVASDPDRMMCERLGVPFMIVAWPLRTYAVIAPCGHRSPIVGRIWSWGTHDCFGLIRDGMLEYGGIEIPDFERHEWDWWNNGKNLIEEQVAAAGFRSIPVGSMPRHLDLFGMQMNAPVVNHLALFLEPETIVHQMHMRLSSRDVYGGIYQRATVLHLRHERLMP